MEEIRIVFIISIVNFLLVNINFNVDFIGLNVDKSNFSILVLVDFIVHEVFLVVVLV